MHSNQIIFIVGPTAVGKTQVALKLAKEIKAEIVSCDSMQVYKEITIASNKPTAHEQEGIVHHGLDMVSVRQDYDVVKYRDMALKAIEDIRRRGKTPVIVGGSGMYMSVLLDDIFAGVEKNPDLRSELLALAQAQGNQPLYERLKQLDPAAAGKIHLNDTKRIIRALEICLATGQPVSELPQPNNGLWGKHPILIFGLQCDRAQLYERINQRVEEMFEKGIVEEVKRLNNDLSSTARGLIGIKEILRYLEGEFDIEKTKEIMKKNTRNYAKRQFTWFRGDQRIQWIDVDNRSTQSAVQHIMQRLNP